MKKVAVIQFPGVNSEYETVRALKDAGMHGEFFRWNDDPKKLDDFDGFVIAGGFAYEDRVRAGLIASLDPVMDEIKVQAAKGKPVLGICNGAQNLIETGLVPGGANHELLMSLAHNRRMQDGKLIGTGFYNENVTMKSAAPKGRTAFTIDYDLNEETWAPAAHGEGRFTTITPGLLEKLQENNQIVFRYDPINPNGAIDDAAAICNPQGNVMAIMPHPERAPSAPMPKIFTSMRKYMEGEALTGTTEPLEFTENRPKTTQYTHQANTIELYIQLIITDNEAQTVQNALNIKGHNLEVAKWVHYEIQHAPGINQDKLAEELIASGELLNTNKENVLAVKDNEVFDHPEGIQIFLVRDIEDSHGEAKTQKIHHHIGSEKVTAIKHGIVWAVKSNEANFDYTTLVTSNIFANFHAQTLQNM